MIGHMERLRRKSLKAKRCPFCARLPAFEFRIEKSRSGSVGHYAIRRGCCQATGTGQTELFFHNKIAVGTFVGMSHRLLSNWNYREQHQ